MCYVTTDAVTCLLTAVDVSDDCSVGQSDVITLTAAGVGAAVTLVRVLRLWAAGAWSGKHCSEQTQYCHDL